MAASAGSANGLLADIKKEVFTYVNLVHAISGMTGGVIAITTFYPLNIVRMKLQIEEAMKAENTFTVAKKIAEKDGVGALYQGWWSSVVSLGASNFVYFYTYNALKTIYRKLILKSDKLTMDPITNLLVASIAGVINVLITTPLWVAGTRLSVQTSKEAARAAEAPGTKQDSETARPYTGVFDCLSRIVAEEGVGALWNGVGPSLVLVSNPSIQFSVYERLRVPLAKRALDRGSPITAVEFFVVGAIAKAVATVLTYPLQIAQSRLRADKGNGEGRKNYTSTLDVLRKIAKENGPLGWFKGMEAKLWQTVLTAAFQFLTYEQVQKAVFAAFKIDPAASAH